MTRADLLRLRLGNQWVAGGGARDPGDVVAHLGALQAQDYTGAKWSLGLRLPGSTEATIDRAIAERTIVRTWPMRGTLHFVAAADVRWMLELLTPRILAGSARRHQQLELEEAVFARSQTLFREALQGGQAKTREEIYRVLEEEGITTAGQRGYHLLWRAAQEQVICFGPHSGKQATFVLLDEWIPAPLRRWERDEALAELALRYFTGHGPATLQDFSWWSGLPAADARAGLESVKSRLTSAVVENKTYWMPPHSQDAGEDALSRLYLLPGFDEYLLGYTDRAAALDPQYAARIVPGGNGVFLPTIIRHGRVVGTWKRILQKKTVTAAALPFQPLSSEEETAFAAAAQAYSYFFS